MSSYFEYLANGGADVEVSPQPQATVAMDQDTVIGDAMCHASQKIYDCAVEVAACINENNQGAIPLDKIKEAELALCYMEGVDFGLAMDDKSMRWYMTELERCLASIEQSRENGFQTQIYVPKVKPWDLFGFDEVECRKMPITFLHLKPRVPSREKVAMLKEELAKDENLRYLFEKGILQAKDFPTMVAPIVVEEDAPQKPEKGAADDSQSVLSLRNLFRQSKIDKSQYIGGLATLVATGLISKSEFTRLKAAAT